uniref:Uncharacterized protein n=1 Tax=Triticum urartu TaxID=4572 RepID=A0A8R7JYB2_TRIUA
AAKSPFSLHLHKPSLGASLVAGLQLPQRSSLCARGHLPALPRPTSSNRIGKGAPLPQASQRPSPPLLSRLSLLLLSNLSLSPFRKNLISLSRVFSESRHGTTAAPTLEFAASGYLSILVRICSIPPPEQLDPPRPSSPVKPLSRLSSLPYCAGHRHRWRALIHHLVVGVPLFGSFLPR